MALLWLAALWLAVLPEGGVSAPQDQDAGHRPLRAARARLFEGTREVSARVASARVTEAAFRAHPWFGRGGSATQNPPSRRRRRIASSTQQRRRTEESESSNATCEIAFAMCLTDIMPGSASCFYCVEELFEVDDDVAMAVNESTVPENLKAITCPANASTVVDFLNTFRVCEDVDPESRSGGLVCDLFDACLHEAFDDPSLYDDDYYGFYTDDDGAYGYSTTPYYGVYWDDDYTPTDDDFYYDDFYAAEDDAYGSATGDDDVKEDDDGALCADAPACTPTQVRIGADANSDLYDCLEASEMDGFVNQKMDPFDPSLWYDRKDLCDGTYDWKELADFQACATDLNYHERFLNDTARDKAAAKCMKILASAVRENSEDVSADDELVRRMAEMVYYFGDMGFCDCVDGRQSGIPKCGDFGDLHVVVAEAEEACYALDVVDCPYLAFYADACRAEFSDPDTGESALVIADEGTAEAEYQCREIDLYGCGGHTVPTVRRWDCLAANNGELSDADKWFWRNVSVYCEGEDIPPGRDVAPTGAPTPDPTSRVVTRAKYTVKNGPTPAQVALIVLLTLAFAFVAAAVAFYLYQKRYASVAGLVPSAVPRAVRAVRRGAGGGADGRPDAEGRGTEMSSYAFRPLSTAGDPGPGSDSPAAGIDDDAAKLKAQPDIATA